MIPYKIIDAKTGGITEFELPFPEAITMDEVVKKGWIEDIDGLVNYSGVAREFWMSAGFIKDVIPILQKYQMPDCPDKITFDGKEYDVPKNIERLAWGAHITAQNLFQKIAKDENKNPYASLQDLFAVFMCQVITGSFDDIAAEGIAEQAGECPAVEVIPVANFFLTAYSLYMKNGTIYSRTQNKQTKDQNNENKEKEQKQPVLTD